MIDSTIYVDFDGTIVDVMPRYYKILCDYLKKETDQILDYNVFVREKRNGKKEHEIVKEALEIDINIEEYVKFKRLRIENIGYLRYDRIIGNPIKAFEKLREKGYNVVLLSQRNKERNLKWEVEHFKIAGAFDNMIVVKPEACNAKVSYLQGNVKTNDIIIGDSLVEVECAKKLGMELFFVNTGLFSSALYQNISSVVDNYEVVVELLMKR